MGRQAELIDQVYANIVRIAVENNAVFHDQETDELHSNLDDEADERTRRAVMRAWRSGEIPGPRDLVEATLSDVLGAI